MDSGGDMNTQEMLQRLLQEQEKQRQENAELRAALKYQKLETDELRAQLARSASTEIPEDISSCDDDDESDIFQNSDTQESQPAPGIPVLPVRESKRGRNKSSVNPREVQSATTKALKRSGTRHRRTKSDDLALGHFDSVSDSIPAKSRGSKDRRHVSMINPHEVNTAIGKNLKTKAGRSRRSRSEVSHEDIKAAFLEQRKTARPHPFLSSEGLKYRSIGSPRAGRAAVSPKQSPRSVRKNTTVTPNRKTGGPRNPTKSTNPYPKRVHPKLGSPTPKSPIASRKATASRPTGTTPKSKTTPTSSSRHRRKLPSRPPRMGTNSEKLSSQKAVSKAAKDSSNETQNENDRLERANRPVTSEDATVENAGEAWEGNFDDDENDGGEAALLDVPAVEREYTVSPVSRARELASKLLESSTSPVSTDSAAVSNAREVARAAAIDTYEVPPISESSRAAKIARAKRLAKQHAMSQQDAVSAAELVAKARRQRESANILIAAGP